MQEEKRHNYILKKIITILCVFVMVFYFLPMNVFAQTIREQVQTDETLEEKLTEELEKEQLQLI